jgi:anti-sigma28 factor (negative regulator of flagellin synthesis)
MAHFSKFLAPGTSKASTPSAVMADPTAPTDVRLSPRVEALRKLVASGQYQVSSRHLAHQILRSAGIKPE